MPPLEVALFPQCICADTYSIKDKRVVCWCNYMYIQYSVYIYMKNNTVHIYIIMSAHRTEQMWHKKDQKDHFLFCQSKPVFHTLVPEVFREVAKTTSGNVGTESHFHAVDSCQINHLTE